MDDLNDHELIVLTLQQCCEIIFSSSSDESEDESNEYEYVTHFVITKNVVPRLQNYVETIVPQFSDRQFKAHFRILPSTFEFVLTLIAIWKMSTPDSYRSICENFDVSRATALKCVRRVIVALEILTPAFITWPNEEKAKAVCDHQCHFIHCYAGNVGSVHDQRVFRLSELKNYLDDNKISQ